MVRVPDFDPNTPSIARVYDYFVGGKDNFAADRDLAERLIGALPDLLPTTVENKEFLARAVTWVANQGIRQFIDVGCGMPTPPTTDEVLSELDWVIDCAGEHLGVARATRYLRRFYPWYIERLELDAHAARALKEALQSAATVDEARELLQPSRLTLEPAS